MSADFTLSDAAARFADLIATAHIVDVSLEAPLIVSPRLKACIHCGAAFLPRRQQRCCSRSCAALHRRQRPKSGCKPRTGGSRNDPLILRLLEYSPFERFSDGRWRFGTRAISGKVVARLIASGRAEIVGRRFLQLVEKRQ
ncbi:hypothetical protein EOW77_0003390 [Bradyrhizobium yuanmingense]|uniref:hypothetical protein n=1 Tax=Bradyrhizobium yuanmingense TaxID=108015 RepID=UPI000FE3AEC8|nr:hypothetical protein [Bradyrhizobium yuanmingense]TGN90891.1 hypothetical protein EOW77_0003390 [Bradyrhizobium yuanmingense]